MKIDKNSIKSSNKVNKTITIRPLTVKEAGFFIEIMNNYYDRKKNSEYFKWQYFSYPKSLYYGAFDKDKYLGGFGIQLQKLKYHDRKITIGKGLDIIIHPNFQKKGIGTLLTFAFEKWAKKNNADALIVLSNNNGRKFLSKKNYQNHMINQMEKKLKNNINKVNLQQFHSKIRQNKLFYFIKDKKWYTWRFIQNPEYKYRQIDLSNKLKVYVKLFKDPKTQESFGDIVDVGHAKNISLLKKAYVEAENYFKEKSVLSVTTWAFSNTRNYEILRRMGYVEMAKQRFLCVKVLNHEYNKLYNFGLWNLMQSDSEVY